MEDLGGPFNWEIINNIVTNKLEKKYRMCTHVDGNTKFEDLGFDSLDVMEVIIEAEGAIKQRVEDRKIKNIVTVNDIYKLFEEETPHGKVYFEVKKPEMPIL